MVTNPRNKAGFSVVEILIVVVVLVIIGGLGYVLYNRLHQAPDTTTATTKTQDSAAASGIQTAPEIKSVDDLTKAEQVLDQSDVSSSSDASQFDTQTSGF